MSLTTRQIADRSLARAIAYFAEKGCGVCVPLTDNQEYDLVIDEGGVLKKIEIKTSSVERNENPVVQIKSVRPNRTGNTIKHFDNTKTDYLFCDTTRGIYVIPSLEVLTKAELLLDLRFDKWRV